MTPFFPAPKQLSVSEAALAVVLHGQKLEQAARHELFESLPHRVWESKIERISTWISLKDQAYRESRALLAFSAAIESHPLKAKINPNINLFVVWSGLLSDSLNRDDTFIFGRDCVEALGRMEIVLRCMDSPESIVDLVDSLMQAAFRIHEETKP